MNSLLSFEILDHEASSLFSVDESTGALRVTTDRLDHETKPLYRFSVRVSDRGSPRYSFGISPAKCLS